MNAAEVERTAPNIAPNIYLWRPVISDPPLCTFRDLQTMTIDDLADLHEVLDLKEALRARAEKDAKR